MLDPSCNNLKLMLTMLLHMFQIWSLSKGRLLRTVYFPAIINAIAMDPGEHAFYAGGRDGKIYIVALNGERNPDSSHGMFIIGSLTDHRFLFFLVFFIFLF